MKNKNRIWIFPFMIMGLILLLPNGCKKEHVSIAPSLTTSAVSDIAQTTATSGGNVTSDGGSTVTARGVCWSTGATPTISDSKTTDGGGTGSFTSSITGLTANTTYNVRAYATNSAGTGYGSAISITTQPIPLAILTTSAVTNITQTTATSGGNVTSDGGLTVTARGVCWSTGTNPTIADSKTTDGAGTGIFTSSITGLTANTTYTVRAYATSSVGTGYGSVISFTTLQVPVLTTSAMSEITQTTAISGGSVTSEGSSRVTARGVCWSTSATPTIADSKTTDGAGPGSFTSTITGLTVNTTYSVRAYATNSAGTGYGNEVTFNTIVYAAIAAGEVHSLALKTDGTLWAWGKNEFGEFGDGTTTNKNAPLLIGSGYAKIATGNSHSLALKTDGTLWSWGNNKEGQLGDGTLVDKHSPVQIGSGFAAIAAGDWHSLALKTDGTLWAWGFSNNGKSGVAIGSGYAAIAAAHYHSLAVKTDGTLWAWGANDRGQLGDGTLSYRSTPVQIGSGYAAIEAGVSYSLALKTDGTLWAWGANDRGHLGDGTLVDKHAPVQIGSGYTAIAAGGGYRQGATDGGHSLAVKTDGTLWAWGSNDGGQLGDGTLMDKNTPVQIGSGYAAISAGGGFSVALKINGTLWTWGFNYFGQLGDGTFVDKKTPVKIGPG